VRLSGATQARPGCPALGRSGSSAAYRGAGTLPALNISYVVEYPTAAKIAGLFDAINPTRSLELNQKHDQEQMKKK